MLLDLHGPQALSAVLGFGVVVAGVRVDLGHSQSEKRQWKELEYILGRGAVGDRREEGVFLAGCFGVGGGFNRADSSLD